jgi:hypothetical protein
MLASVQMAKSNSTPPIRRSDAEADAGIGGIVDEIASSWIVGDALTRLVDTGEKVVRAQQSAFSALGLPSGSQFESLTLRVRTLFHRIEELEDDLDRVERRVASLEAAQAATAQAVKAKATPRAKKPAAKSSAARTPTASKRAASKTANKPATRKSAAKKPAAKRTASK